MISFVNDYSESACPEILKVLVDTNMEGNTAYSSDKHTLKAVQLIRKKIKSPNAEVQILVGGTQTNLIAVASFLRPHEAIIAVSTGHICVHETGAIESTGHKCIEVAGIEGKVIPEDIEKVCGPQYWEHAGILCVKPKMVYISQSTEIGTVYSVKELQMLRSVCDKYGLFLYCDGVRLASALDCSDVTLPILAEMCDAFYIGGTKNGALLGEALVITNDSLKNEFRYIAKQRGGMLAKGWLLGLQFEILMENNLYENIGRHQNKMAHRLKNGLLKLGVKFAVNSPSNQLFPIFRNDILQKLEKDFAWEVINVFDENYTEIRLVTSWATQTMDVDAFLTRLEDIMVECGLEIM